MSGTEYEAYDQADGWVKGETSEKKSSGCVCDIHPPIMAPIFTGPVVSQRQENFARTRRTDACQRSKAQQVHGRRGQAWRCRDAEVTQRKAGGGRYFASCQSCTRCLGPQRLPFAPSGLSRALQVEWDGQRRAVRRRMQVQHSTTPDQHIPSILSSAIASSSCHRQRNWPRDRRCSLGEAGLAARLG